MSNDLDIHLLAAQLSSRLGLVDDQTMDLQYSSDGQSFFIDVFGKMNSGRITAWADGNVDFEVLNTDAEQLLFVHCNEIKSISDLEPELTAFMSALAEGNPRVEI